MLAKFKTVEPAPGTRVMTPPPLGNDSAPRDSELPAAFPWILNSPPATVRFLSSPPRRLFTLVVVLSRMREPVWLTMLLVNAVWALPE